MVAPVPLVTTIARDPEDAVLLLMLKADPVVAPLIESITIVEEAVIEEFVRVKVRSAAAAIDTDVKVARPDLPFTTTGEAAVPEAEAEVKRIPVPEVDPTKLPLVAVILPRVAVIVVPALSAVPAANVVVVANDPGAMIVVGNETVAVVPTVVTVIWLAVPRTELIVPEDPPSICQLAERVPPALDKEVRV